MIRRKTITAERCRVPRVAVVERAYACLLLLSSKIRRRFRASADPLPGHDAMGESAPASVAPVVVASEDGPLVEDTLAQIANHLTYLGYDVSEGSDGWSYARHTSRRYSFALRVVPQGVRLHCSVDVGALSRSSRHAWLEFLNGVGDRSHVARFALVEEEQAFTVRMRAWVAGAYSRAAFATVMDMWHDDQDVLRHKPEAAAPIRTANTDTDAGITVH